MTHQIFIAQSDAEITACFEAFKVLRPNISKDKFLPQVRRQQEQAYQIVALQRDREVKSAAGFRISEFLAWGKVLYIDDLTTLEGERGNGYASSVLDWLTAHAKQMQCASLHLDTGYARHAAHRVYLKKGFQLNCHHLELKI
ncbi:MAG: GNAT family N-acetyltransferase [Xanthomonadales bacterium]|nr:GNAT family N-acetyltransferase [Xanthomonadales bacterium]